MQEILHILEGALFTVAVCAAAGKLILARLRLEFHRLEAMLVAFVAGAACTSFATFFLCVTHQARKGFFLWPGLLLIIWALRAPALRRSAVPWKPIPRAWKLLFLVVFTSFFIIYFLNALAPEISPDGSGYHLGNVARFWKFHGFAWDYHNMYSYLSQGMEMLFLIAFSFGKHSSAALVHFAFQTTLPLLIVCYGLRFGYPRVGVFAAVLIYAAPVIGLDGSSAYNDLTVATVIFAVFYLLQVWDEERNPNLLILIGLLSGFAFAVKYTAVLTLPFAAGYVLWRLKKDSLRPLVMVTAPALLLIFPWLLRNWIWLGNPAAPFLNSWFPNPYYHPGMEQIYLQNLKYYGVQHGWEIPVQLAVRGGLVGGFLGPVFLLAPLALLALRQSQGRRLLLAAAIFAIPAAMNSGSRFLIPALPFLALSMGLACANSSGVLAVLAIFHAYLCWPAHAAWYCDDWAWRISSVPVQAALRKVPETEFIENHQTDYKLKTLIEHTVPPDGKIFSFAGRPEAYFDRTIVTSYESTLGNRANDALLTPVSDPAPTHRTRFRFLPLRTRRVRVVETASASPFWTVTEMRVFSNGTQLPRESNWRLSAWPNGWEVQLAFDNNYATRWSTWQAMEPHMYIAVDFGSVKTIDAVLLEGVAESQAHLQVEVFAHGDWVPITDTAEESDVRAPSGLRRAATLELKQLGIDYLWVNDSDYASEDMKKYSNSWGITLLGESNGTRFYRID
ncbi:MAG TPA: discoidin domain-containing protein [Bryobacteraceae bacterium]|nr:discoidin domain-containing protein [Bryobacteraceae bacterium]